MCHDKWYLVFGDYFLAAAAYILSNIVQKYFHFVSILYQFLSPCKVITKLKYVDTFFVVFSNMFQKYLFSNILTLKYVDKHANWYCGYVELCGSGLPKCIWILEVKMPILWIIFFTDQIKTLLILGTTCILP